MAGGSSNVRGHQDAARQPKKHHGDASFQQRVGATDMFEDLTKDEIEEFMAGYWAASRGEPHWPHNTQAWLDGYAFQLQIRAQRDDRDAKTCH